jgi:hypothetical protein
MGRGSSRVQGTNVSNDAGGVVLETIAAPDAILLLGRDHYQGSEVIVDPYRLGQVRLIERRAPSMQPLVHDQPQPLCHREENNSAERSGGDYHAAK